MPREDVRFYSGGERCAAWLYLPEGDERPAGDNRRRPCVVLGHGFGATRHRRLWAYAERFAAAGMPALAFDYRGFGDSEGEPRQLLDVDRQLEDWRSALVFARSLPVVDADRVALWGSSFAGGHVVRVAAADAGVAAVVSQVPFTTGIAATRVLALRQSARLLVAGLRDVLGALAGREPRLVPVVGRPGELAAITTPEAVSGYQAMYEAAPARNEVAARVLLRVPTYAPAWSASRVRCPLLVCVGDEDGITPPEPAERMAARAPRGELVRYPIRHYDIYTGEWFERAVADQTEFLARHLLGAGAETVVAAAVRS